MGRLCVHVVRHRNMNILIICHHRRFKTFIRPLPLATHLAKRGHRVDFVCVSDRGRTRTTECEDMGVRIVETPDLFCGNARSGWDPVSVLHRISWLKGQDVKWDVIQTLESRPATIYPLKWFLRRRPTPLVMDWIDWWGRGGLISEARPRWYQILFGRMETYFEEAFRTMADGTTAISRPLMQRAVGLGVDPESVFVLRNGVQPICLEQALAFDRTPTMRSAVRDRYGIPQDAQVIMFSALDVFFDVELVLRSVVELVPRFPRLCLVITGPERVEIARLASQLGLSDRTRQLGRLLWERNFEVMLCADMLALPLRDTPSNRGRWPSKAGDYMAAGRAIVANPVGDVADVIREAGTGLLAAYEPKSFAEACARLLKDDGLRQKTGLAGRNYVKEHLLWDKLVGDLEQFYRNVIERFDRAERPRV